MGEAMTVGVGFLGAGPVAQAIHIPALQVLGEAVRIVAIMDVNEALARSLAHQHVAAWTCDEDELIDNSDVDVVVVGSPNAHHARQIIKACAAGKRAVLAEKPLAVSRDEAAAIVAAATASGTRIIVGAMHAYDHGYLQALAAWRETGEQPVDIEVTAFLHPNDALVDEATQLVRGDAPPAAPGARPTDVAAMTMGILGLASHDIPLVRDFLDATPELIGATRQQPAGYSLQGIVGDCAVSFIGMLSLPWEPHWRLRVVAPHAVLDVHFPQSYVLATGCTASLTVAGVTRTWHHDEAAYVTEWRQLLAELEGAPPQYPLARVEADLGYALGLIQQLPALVNGGVA